jgi:hypothetical protein
MQALALASLIWLSATAPTPAAEPQAEPARGIAQSAGAGGKKKKVIRLDAITVEGRIQKPQAFYILQRSNLNFDDLNRTESFVPKVVKSVEKDPF